jgi:hypothetical protein
MAGVRKANERTASAARMTRRDLIVLIFISKAVRDVPAGKF